MLKRFLASALIAVGGTAMGQIVSASFDILDGADVGGPSPAGVIVIDGFVDVATTDVWTAAGVRCATSNGATMIYSPNDAEPNVPGFQTALVNTGTADRFLTSMSKPRGRNGDPRFTNGGAAIAGGYDPALPGGDPGIATPTLLNAAWFASPPESSGSPSVDGYIVRLAISTPGFDSSNVTLGGPTAPAGFGILLASIVGNDDGTTAPGWVNATFDNPTPGGGNIYLWGVPEPASLTLLALGALAFRRR